jgi:hypothetical protein
VLERFVGSLAERVAGDIELDAPGHVLDSGEARLAHYPLEHHAARHRRTHGCRLQLFVGLARAGLVQIAGQVGAPVVVREGIALAAQRLELGAPLGYDLVLFRSLSLVPRQFGVVVHSWFNFSTQRRKGRKGRKELHEGRDPVPAVRRSGRDVRAACEHRFQHQEFLCGPCALCVFALRCSVKRPA